MSKHWLTILGVGADGLASLSGHARAHLDNAEIIIASKRLVQLVDHSDAEIHNWPSPFDPMVTKIKSWKGKKIVLLATGDPMWFGAGSTLCRHFEASDLNLIPAPSAFSLAASRLGWPLADVEFISLHGRPVSLIAPLIQPSAKILALTAGSKTVHEVGKRLIAQGFGSSHLHVLENMGAVNEQLISFTAREIPDQEFSSLNTLAIECIADKNATILPRTCGLPDTAFKHDGQLTKQQVRAITGSTLAPAPGQLLWDVGAGCGSIGIEWMRHHLSNRTLAFENNAMRIDLIKHNAENLGAPYLKIIEGSAPESLKNQPAPNAIFIGGGITIPHMFENCWQALMPQGRLVANCVTIASRQKLIELQSEHGGMLTEIAISNLAKLGTQQAMRPALPVLQWRILK